MTFTDVLSRVVGRTATLASKLRELVMVDLKFITELPGASANIVGYGNGTGYKNLICTILLPKKGVKLVFTKALNCLILETYWQELEKDTALQR